MKFDQTEQFSIIFKQAIHEFAYLLRQVWRWLIQLPAPQLLLACLALAFAVTILPLAISLFMLFMLLKFMLVVVAIATRKNRQKGRQISQ